MLLAEALRRSHWRPVQAILMAGAVDCRSPELDQATVVGYDYEIRLAEVQAATRMLGEIDRESVRRYLHAEVRLIQREDGEWVAAAPTMHTHQAEAFDRLWRTLAEQGWLHAPTRELCT